MKFRPSAGTLLVSLAVIIAAALVVGFVLNQLQARGLVQF